MPVSPHSMPLCGSLSAGAAAAALGLDASSSIPPITMVFCMVDGAKDWKFLGDKAKRHAVQRVMKDVLINTLVAVKGSYLCRLQEDEFKYMVAFPEPEVGVEPWEWEPWGDLGMQSTQPMPV